MLTVREQLKALVKQGQEDKHVMIYNESKNYFYRDDTFETNGTSHSFLRQGRSDILDQYIKEFNYVPHVYAYVIKVRG